MEESTYQVEKLLAKRRRNGKDEYLIKWLNYDSSHNTWEPRKNIFDPNLLLLFDAEWNAKEAERMSEQKVPVPKKLAHNSQGEKRQKSSHGQIGGTAIAHDLDSERETVVVELRQHQEDVCTLRLTEALCPDMLPDPSSAPILLPTEIFAALQSSCTDGTLTVKHRARLEDVHSFLLDERVLARVYVWGAEPNEGAGMDARTYSEACDRLHNWCNDLITRDRAAVVQVPRIGSLGSDLFIIPPSCKVWAGLQDAGARLEQEQIAVALVCADREADAAHADEQS